MSSKNPTVTCLSVDERSPQRAEFLIEGGEHTWTLDDDQRAYCKFNVWMDREQWSIGSMGGSVWLSGWPWLFDLPSNLAVRGWWITEEGKALLQAALDNYEKGESDGVV